MICGETPLYSSSSIYSVSSFTRLHIQSSLCFLSAFVATPGPVFLSSYSSHHHALHIEFSFTFSISVFLLAHLYLPLSVCFPFQIFYFHHLLFFSSCVLFLLSSTFPLQHLTCFVNILLISSFYISHEQKRTPIIFHALCKVSIFSSVWPRLFLYRFSSCLTYKNVLTPFAFFPGKDDTFRPFKHALAWFNIKAFRCYYCAGWKHLS